MRPSRPVALLLRAVALACCGEERFTATGDVVAVDEAGLRVTLRHDDIPGLMPAMTMAFPARSRAVVAGVTVGTRVRFQLARTSKELVVTRLEPVGAANARARGFTTTPRTTAASSPWSACVTSRPSRRPTAGSGST